MAIYKNGDIFISTADGGGMHQYDGTTHAHIRSYGGGDYTGAWLSPLGHLWVIFWRSQRIECWDANGNVLWSKGTAWKPESVAFDRVGYAYVGYVEDFFGGGGEAHLEKFTLGGASVGTWITARDARSCDHIEFHGDGQTLYHTSEGASIFRWNTKTNSQAGTFTTYTGGSCKLFGIRRVASDGSWIVAERGSGAFRFAASGAFMRAYPIPGSGFFGMDIETDGLHFWIGTQLPGGASGAHKVNLASGAIVATIATPDNYESNAVNVIKTKTPLLKVS